MFTPVERRTVMTPPTTWAMPTVMAEGESAVTTGTTLASGGGVPPSVSW